MEARPPKKKCFGIGFFRVQRGPMFVLIFSDMAFVFFSKLSTTGCHGEITLKFRKLFNPRTSLTFKKTRKFELRFFKIVSLLVRPVFLWLSDSLIRGTLGTLT